MPRKKQKSYAPVIVSLFIAFIMITSVIGFIFGGSTQQTTKYNNYKFVLTSQGWRTMINGKPAFFSYSPPDVELIELGNVNLKDYRELDVTYDINSSFKEGIAQSIFEMGSALLNSGVFIVQGFTTNTSFNRPILTCDDATQFVPVIYFKQSNISQISEVDNCIIVESTDETSFLAYSNRLTYGILGIIE